VKAHYAFKEQVAMVDFTYNEGKTSDAPLAKVYTSTRYVSLSDLLSLQLHGLLVGCSDRTSVLLLVWSASWAGEKWFCLVADVHVVSLQAYIKAGAGEKGFGPLSVGFIVDKTIDV